VSYQAVYYRDSNGREPVNDFIDGVGPACQDSIDWYIDLLNGLSDSNPERPFPHSSALKGASYRAFRELRPSCGRVAYRILFRRSGRFFLLLHAFEKRSREVHEREMEVALNRWNDFKARMDSIPRGDPRAIGHDAP
jgi:phage-related protein